MARQDPSRPIRSLFTREFLALIRNARQRALTELQPLLRQKSLDAGEILKILEMLNLAYIDQPGRALIQRYVLQAYRSGLGNTHNILIAQVKSPSDKIQIGLNFTRPDERAISNLSATSFADLKGFTSEISKKIVRDMVEAEKKGAGITKLSGIIQEHYTGIGAARAEVIARTSTSQAYNQASYSRIEEYAPFKEWIPTLGDGRTRPSHLAMKGVIVEADQPFDVPAYRASVHVRVLACQMMFPGDTSLGAPAAQVIQCRCAVVPAFKRK